MAQVWEHRDDGAEYTLSNCGSGTTAIAASAGLHPQIPPGVINQIPFQVYECCGNCSVDAQEVRLYYFPDETASTHCSLNSLDNSTSSITKQPQRLVAANSIAILSGYTLYVADHISFVNMANLRQVPHLRPTWK